MSKIDDLLAKEGAAAEEFEMPEQLPEHVKASRPNLGRPAVVSVRLSAEEHGQLQRAAEQVGLPVSTFLTMTTMPLAEVKAHLSELVGRVHAHHERVTVTVHGRPSAVLLAVEDLEALEETLSVLSDPDTLRRLVESDAELARGEVVGTEVHQRTVAG